MTERREEQPVASGLLPMDFQAWLEAQDVTIWLAAALMGEALVAGYNAAATAAIAMIPEHADLLVDLMEEGPVVTHQHLAEIGNAARAHLMVPPSADVANHVPGKP